MATSADVLNGAWVFGDADGARLGRATRLIWVIVACMAALFAWAYFARLDEVATGAGRVVPSTREQVIQSLEGGHPRKTAGEAGRHRSARPDPRAA